MKYELDEESCLFAIGEVAPAKHFWEGIPFARSVAADFPVLTASLEHIDYVALNAALETDAPVSLTMQMVPHASTALLQLTLGAGAFRVHWLSDANAPEVWAAVEAWRRAGECAFAMMLPDSAPYNCLFGRTDFVPPSETEKMRPRKFHSNASTTPDLMRAMIEVGNCLQEATDGFDEASTHRDLVNLLMTSRVEEQVRKTSTSLKSALGAIHGAKTLH